MSLMEYLPKTLFICSFYWIRYRYLITYTCLVIRTFQIDLANVCPSTIWVQVTRHFISSKKTFYKLPVRQFTIYNNWYFFTSYSYKVFWLPILDLLIKHSRHFFKNNFRKKKIEKVTPGLNSHLWTEQSPFDWTVTPGPNT